MARRAVKRGIPVHVELQFTQGWRRFPGSMTNISETPPTATPGTPVVFLEGDTEPSVGETSAYQLTIDAQVVQTSAHLKQLQSRVGTTNTITGRIILPEGTPAIASGDDGGTVAVDGSTVDFAFAGTQAYPGACLKIAGEYLEVDQVNADGSIKSLINNPTAARDNAAWEVVQGAGKTADVEFVVNSAPFAGTIAQGPNPVATGQVVLSVSPAPQFTLDPDAEALP